MMVITVFFALGFPVMVFLLIMEQDTTKILNRKIDYLVEQLYKERVHHKKEMQEEKALTESLLLVEEEMDRLDLLQEIDDITDDWSGGSCV